MASGTANYWANKLLDLVAGATAFTAPGTSFMGLYTATPTASTAGTEASGGSYARATNTNNGTTWSAAASGVKQNAVAFTFTTASASWSSGSNMVGAALLDSATGGTNNIFYFGDLTLAKPVLNGDTASFAINAITITVT
jgi:hypothetical protein